jgi:hypothetical protein
MTHGIPPLNRTDLRAACIVSSGAITVLGQDGWRVVVIDGYDYRLGCETTAPSGSPS